MSIMIPDKLEKMKIRELVLDFSGPAANYFSPLRESGNKISGKTNLDSGFALTYFRHLY